MARPLSPTLITLFTLAILTVAGLARAQDEDAHAERRALARAAALVPLEVGVRVALIDPDLAPDPAPLLRLDAFVVRNTGGGLRPVIYVNRRSSIVRAAAAGSELDVFVLAAVIHHEARHLAGASEADARAAEVEFFRALVDRRRIARRD